MFSFEAFDSFFPRFVEFFFEVEFMKPIILSTDGVGRGLDVPSLRALGK